MHSNVIVALKTHYMCSSCLFRWFYSDYAIEALQPVQQDMLQLNIEGDQWAAWQDLTLCSWHCVVIIYLLFR